MPVKALPVLAGLLLALPALTIPSTARADDWDGFDDVPARRMPDLAHGSDEAHDLAALPGPAPDVDLSQMPQDPYSSWEVIIDGLTGASVGVKLQRLNADGTVILENANTLTIAGGFSRTLTWANAGDAASGCILSAQERTKRASSVRLRSATGAADRLLRAVRQGDSP